ncbi:MAG TPA: hypothetical protein VMJ72_01685 [Candidatus Paceibacterota bacterium]|nr:hypothetical protein [Candidatus Paceibacterota bacterium]
MDAMLAEMANFPWKALGPLEAAIETEAADHGLFTGRRKDDVLIATLVADAHRASQGSKVKVLDRVQGPHPRPRSRAMVLSLQAMVCDGLRAAIIDDPKKNAAALVVFPTA